MSPLFQEMSPHRKPTASPYRTPVRARVAANGQYFGLCSLKAVRTMPSSTAVSRFGNTRPSISREEASVPAGSRKRLCAIEHRRRTGCSLLPMSKRKAASCPPSSAMNSRRHIVLDHEAEAPVDTNGQRAWNKIQEREADWLAGCFLIPHDAAHAVARDGQTDDPVAATFGVSASLATWRMNNTGARIHEDRAAKYVRRR